MKTRIARHRVLALILAGGQGKRMGPLTRHRAKPVLPFAGEYRLIDFALSNCVHSGIHDVWVIEQYELHSLNDHLSSGRPWDLDRTHGGLQVLPPYATKDEDGFAQGNADAIFRNRHLIREFDPDVLLVLSADHVYLLDFADVIRHHLERKASVTMVATPLPPGETASRFGNVKVDGSGRVTDFAYKPDEPLSDLVTTEVFAYDARHLLATLERLVDDEGELQDFGNELVPSLVEEGRAYAYPFDGYWRDVGTPEAYWRTHMELIDGQLPRLDGPDWPVLTYSVQRQPSRFEGDARVVDSLISSGCHVRGTVERSVLAPGVIVEEGAVVREAVVLRDAVIRAGTRVERALVDERTEVRADVKGEGEEIAVASRDG